MVGADFVWNLYQNSGPALQILLILGGGYIWKHDIEPRLKDLEQTQEDRRDRWDEQELNAQERTLLIDDAHGRLDEVDEAVERLKRRVRGIESSYAVDHEKAPNGWTSGDPEPEGDD